MFEGRFWVIHLDLALSRAACPYDPKLIQKVADLKSRIIRWVKVGRRIGFEFSRCAHWFRSLEMSRDIVHFLDS